MRIFSGLIAPLRLVDPAFVSADGITPFGERGKSQASRWSRLCQDFLRCHRRPLNVLLHLVTTPLGLFGVIGLVHSVSVWGCCALTLAYSAFLMLAVPARVWIVTSAVLTALLWAVHFFSPSWQAAAACVIVGYFGQDLSHWFASERTLQSTYLGKKGFVSNLLEHTTLLLPVLLVISSRRRQSPLRMLVSRLAVLSTQLNTGTQRTDLAAIREWVRVSQPDLNQSTHWWQQELEETPRRAFDRLSHDEGLMAMIQRFHGPGYTVEPVRGMNELYVTGPQKSSTSDTVFYMGHVDGPWAVFPGARLYRCMVAASPNAEVTTHYPMCGTNYNKPLAHRLETGDAVAFDFNRELHFITRDPSDEQLEPRVNLKLHFIAYPSSLRWYGKLLARLTTDYDIRARKLFLQTIDPDRPWDRVKAQWVLRWTSIFELVVRYLGWTNLAYTLLMAAISWGLDDWRWFVVTTSFVHYGIYLGTFRETNPVAFGIFRRNAIFFKTLAMTQLFLLYAAFFSSNWLSLGTVLAGFSLATCATAVLGVNRTYFSAELGFDPPMKVKRFPYGVIPHPMVLGAMMGIGGMWLVPGLRHSCAWLLSAHLICYSAVLFQEILVSQSSAAGCSTSWKQKGNSLARFENQETQTKEKCGEAGQRFASHEPKRAH